jgi:hypothetical protein
MLAGLGAASESGVQRQFEGLPPPTTGAAAVQGCTGSVTEAAADPAAQLLNPGGGSNMLLDPHHAHMPWA